MDCMALFYSIGRDLKYVPVPELFEGLSPDFDVIFVQLKILWASAVPSLSLDGTTADAILKELPPSAYSIITVCYITWLLRPFAPCFPVPVF